MTKKRLQSGKSQKNSLKVLSGADSALGASAQKSRLLSQLEKTAVMEKEEVAGDFD